jgi:putative flippase GtrA
MVARWLTFNAVGMIGVFLQLAWLWLLREVVQLPYQVATAAAVELTVLHNFAWHLRWTWRDRPVPASALVWRLLRFNASNGAFSIAGNVLLMTVFLRFLPGHYLLANLASIAICSMVNFVAAEAWTFRREVKGAETVVIGPGAAIR